MSELQDILAASATLPRGDASAVLATVMQVQGSTYRRPGARMLILGDGRSVGLISGGCVDTDLRERAAKVMASGEPSLVTYDSTSPQDIVMGLGIGCSGVMHTLLEPCDPWAEDSHLKFIADSLRGRAAAAVATVYEVTGKSGIRIGSRMMINRAGTWENQITDPDLSERISAACREALKSGASAAVQYPTATGSARVFIEHIAPPQSLLIFGAGAGAFPLARLAGELGWHVTVIDHRPAYATRESFPGAEAVILSEPGEIESHVTLLPGDATVIMTHNFNTDCLLLRSLLASPVRYVGLLGPRAKAEMLLDRLRHEGFDPTGEQLARLYAPVGLDIGAESPQEIALAIVAEIRMVLADRHGGSLRNRTTPIHQ